MPAPPMPAPPCPRCSAPLQPQAYGSASFHGCARCGGVWLAPGVAEQLASHLPTEGGAHAPHPHPPAAGLRCPVCQGGLVPHHSHGVELDSCRAHGTWFDHRELEVVVQGLRGGWRDRGRPAAPAPMPGPGVAVAAGALGVIGGAAAAQALSGSPQVQRAVESQGVAASDAVEAGVEVAAELVDAGDVLGAVVDGAGVALEVGGSLFGALGDLLSGL